MSNWNDRQTDVMMTWKRCTRKYGHLCTDLACSFGTSMTRCLDAKLGMHDTARLSNLPVTLYFSYSRKMSTSQLCSKLL